MLELDELDHLHVVADGAQKLGPRGIRHFGGKPLTQCAVAEQRIERRARELGEQLVLAARHGEDHRGAGTNGAVEGVVGGGIAGMEADDEVDALERGVPRDVAHLEPEAVGAERAGERLTVIHDIGLEVETDDLDLALMDDREQIMEREGQVRLAGAEVDDAERALGRERGEHVLDELEKPVHLPELVVALRPHLSLGRHHAELDEEGHRHPLGEHPLLDTVVPERHRRTRRRPAQDLGVAPAPAREHLPVGVGRLQHALPELAVEQLHEAVGGGVRKQVLVARAALLVCREAVPQRARDRHRCDDDAGGAGRVAPPRPAQAGPRERRLADESADEPLDIVSFAAHREATTQIC